MVGTAVWEGQQQKRPCTEAMWESPCACDGKGDDAREVQKFFPLSSLFLLSQMLQKIQRIQSAGAAGRHRSPHSTPPSHLQQLWLSFVLNVLLDRD